MAMQIKNSDLTTCDSLRNAMMALMPAIGDAAYARDPFTLHDLMRVWLRMDSMLKSTERSIRREVDKAEFVAED